MPVVSPERLELPTRYARMVRDVLERCVPDSQVWAYGSRVTGGCHDASDLDLVLRNPSDPARAEPALGRLRESFSESNIPIRVDVHDWARLPAEFRAEIERAYVVLVPGDGG
ncbi:MAG: nucleotidyltransferase family protein [Armatimonadaceae bacterium]